MGYTPTIIADSNQLKQCETVLEEIVSKKQTTVNYHKQMAATTLLHALKEDPITFKGISFYIIEVEFSEKNKGMRELLTRLKIEYTTFN